MTRARPTAVALRAIGLGDFVAGLPALSLLGAALPGHRLVAAVPRALAPVLAASGLADEVVGVGELEPLPARLAGPGLAVDLHGNGRASRDLLAALHPLQLLAFGSGPGAPEWDDDEPEVARWCRLVREGLDADLPDPALPGLLPRFPVPDGLPAGATVVHPGAARAARRWPVHRFAALVSRLTELGHRVVLTGTPGEADLVRAAAGDTPAAVLTGLDVAQLCGLVGAARLVVSNDTGVAHLASAYATPSVVLFGPVSPRLWGPPAGVPWHRALHPVGPGDPPGGRPGDAHGGVVDPILLRITVDDVLAAVHDVLGVERRRAS